MSWRPRSRRRWKRAWLIARRGVHHDAMHEWAGAGDATDFLASQPGKPVAAICHGPWTLVEANDKRWARVKVLRTINRALEEAFEKSDKKAKKHKD